METAKKVAKNTTWLFVGDNITKVISLVLAVLIARFLSVEEFGIFSFALGFTSLFSVLTDMGISAYLRRELSRHHEESDRYISNALAAKLALSLGTAAAIYGTVNIMGYPFHTKLVVYAGSFSILFESLANTFAAAFIAFEKVKYNAYTKILRVILRFSITIPILLLGKGALGVMEAYLFVQAFSLAVGFWFFNARVKRFRPAFDMGFAASLVKKGLPFGIATVFIMIYFKIDITMLSKMAGDAQVAWYSAAYNLLESLYFLPIALTSALLPVTSRVFKESIEKMKRISDTASKFLFSVTLPMSVFVSMTAGMIIGMIYGERYASSAAALQLLIWTTIPSFFTYVLGLMLVSSDNEKVGMYTTGTAAFVNVVLNFLLIPRYGYMGAAAATLATETLLAFVNFAVVSRKLFVPSVPVLKPAIASAVMGAVLYFLKGLAAWMPKESILYEIAVFAGIALLSAATYIAALLLIKGITDEEKSMIRSILKGKLSR